MYELGEQLKDAPGPMPLVPLPIYVQRLSRFMRAEGPHSNPLLMYLQHEYKGQEVPTTNPLAQPPSTLPIFWHP